MQTREPLDTTTLDDLSQAMVTFLETGEAPDNLFAPDVFCDLSMPTWRLQTGDRAAVVDLRRSEHQGPSKVTRWRSDPIPGGFVFEFEERWDDGGSHWYSRELLRADVIDGSIAELAVYCTGDWDADRQAEHARTVTLLRP